MDILWQGTRWQDVPYPVDILLYLSKTIIVRNERSEETKYTGHNDGKKSDGQSIMDWSAKNRCRLLHLRC